MTSSHDNLGKTLQKDKRPYSLWQPQDSSRNKNRAHLQQYSPELLRLPKSVVKYPDKRGRVAGSRLLTFSLPSAEQTIPYDVIATTVHSSICNAILPNEGNRLERRWEGLINSDSRSPTWVICPFPIDRSYFAPGDEIFAYVYARNTTSQPVELSCLLRMRGSGRPEGVTASGSRTISPGRISRVYLKIINEDRRMGHALTAISCKLRPGVSLREIVYEFFYYL